MMFNRVKNAIFNVVGGMEPTPGQKDTDSTDDKDRNLSPKFPYTRPHFLQFHAEEEIQVSADHHIRPIIVPRDINVMPWNAGYAEAVNAGKSRWNEDQACIHRGLLTRPERNGQDRRQALSMSYTYFGLFDGHAGVGAAVAAANQLHHIIHEKLIDVLDHLLPPLPGSVNKIETATKGGISMYFAEKEVTKESVIIGALESAFWDMDQLIGEDKLKYRVKGGCTVLVALFIDGKLFLANAGDSRAVLCRNGQPIPLSNDFTPETERQRVRHLAALQPELLGGEFTHLDYCRRPAYKDLGKRILYRDWYMTGWGYKTVTTTDLKVPVVYGEGKRSRVLATIGVTRGFGDHDLKALYSNIPIKPFLLCQPEVRVVECCGQTEFQDNDVLVMGTDGLWDVTSNERVAELIQKSLKHFPSSDINKTKYRYTLAAQDLVMQSRGKLQERNWRTSDGKSATIDDISVFVIPMHLYKNEHEIWASGVARLRENIETFEDPIVPESVQTTNRQAIVPPSIEAQDHFQTSAKEELEIESKLETDTINNKYLGAAEDNGVVEL